MDNLPAAADARIDHAAALSYWSSVPATVNGMLGGYPQISRIDLQGSANFLAKLRRQTSNHRPSGRLSRGADCGAGIGRVTHGFLANVCEVVDVVEPVASFVKEIRDGDQLAAIRERGQLGEVFDVPLEEWHPAVERYELIWNQWCLGHLTDVQLVDYLARCRLAVKNGGWVVVKENVSGDGGDEYDPLDNSVTRADKKYRALFERAGLKITKTETQAGFPKALGLYPVRFYALKPAIISA